MMSQLKSVPAEWQARGIEAQYWQSVARDPYLEQRLLKAIVARSTALERQATATPSSAPADDNAKG